MRYFAKRMHTKSARDVIIKPRSESSLPSIAMQIHMLFLSMLWHCHRHMTAQTYCILLICSAPFCFPCADFPIAWLNNIDIAETRMVECVARQLGARDSFSECSGSNLWCTSDPHFSIFGHRDGLWPKTTPESCIVDWPWKITFDWILK